MPADIETATAETTPEATDLGDTAEDVEAFFSKEPDAGEKTDNETTPAESGEEAAEEVGTSGPPSEKGDEDSADSEGKVDDSVEDDSHDDTEPQFTPELLEQAQEVGLSEAAARAFPTPDDLIAVITHIGQATGKATGEADTASQDGKDVKATDDAAGEEKPAVAAIDWDHLREELGDEATDAMKSFTENQDSRMAQIEGRLQVSEQAELQRQTQNLLLEYDKQFERLDRPKLFGKGPTATMDGKSPEFAARLEFLKYTEPFAVNMRRHRGDALTVDEIVDSAFRTLHPSQETSSVTKAVKKSLRTRAASTVPRNTGKTGDKDPGRDAAIGEMKVILADSDAGF